ncbi:MAG: hypothetical protein IPK17_33695 [Chloroflexi bacterium]|uniref:hypothetical protein n=1 Tax=Candidatus Flexifilum breve TaxID=3140694 RepID=UPI0031353CF4|nr:hypothetical protein [Chloroflexota bacterium]
MRWPFLGVEGVPGDLFLNGWWGEMSYKAGFEVYRLTEANHPPIFLVLNGLSQAVAEIPFVWNFLESVQFTWTMRLKLWPITAEILLILILWRWLRGRGALRWLIPLVIALHPAFILDSVMWGQSDPIFTLFLVVALMAFNEGKVRLAWVLYALALLTKFQSIVLLPLLVVLTWRRWQAAPPGSPCFAPSSRLTLSAAVGLTRSLPIRAGVSMSSPSRRFSRSTCGTCSNRVTGSAHSAASPSRTTGHWFAR